MHQTLRHPFGDADGLVNCVDITSLLGCCASRIIFLPYLMSHDGLDYGEIASRLAISEKSVQRRLVQSMLHCNRRMNGLL